MPGEEEVKDQEKQEEKQEEEKQEEKLTPAEIFDQAFSEAIEVKDEEEQPPPEDKEEKEEKKEEEPPKGEEDKEKAEKKEEPPPEKQEAKPPKEAPKEEARQEEKKEEPPPKASEDKGKKEEQAKAKEEEKVDYTLFFKGLENDIEDEAARKEYVDVLKDSEDIGKAIVTHSELVGKRVIKLMNESFKVMIERLNPYLEATRNYIETSHQSAIKQTHKDFDELKDNPDVLKWIEEQPKYLQKTLMTVYRNGEAGDVVDMLNRYKKDRGLTGKEEEKTDPEKEAEKLRKKEKTNKIIDNLESVHTKSRPIGQGTRASAAESYDDAFDEAASAKRR